VANDAAYGPAELRWEQSLLDDYSEYRWQLALDPLAALLERWRAGAIEAAVAGQGVREAQRRITRDEDFFTDARSVVLARIQSDRAWFEPWLMAHPVPPGIRLA
jgi:hypothetical protein